MNVLNRLMPLALAGLVAAPAGARAATAKTQEGIHWESSYSTALKIAAKEKKNVLVDFMTDWCSWCKVQDESTYAVPSFVEFSRKYVWVKIDAEKQDSLIAQKYEVRAYPTVVVMNAKGEEYDRVVGYNRPAPFQQQVTDYCAARNTLKSMLAEEPKHNTDWGFQARLALKLLGYGRQDEALARYKAVFLGDVRNESGEAEDAGYMFARSVRRAGRFDEALTTYQQLLDRFPQGQYRPNIVYGMALAYKGKGEKDKAIAEFEEYLSKFPNDSGVEDAKKELEALKNPASNP